MPRRNRLRYAALGGLIALSGGVSAQPINHNTSRQERAAQTQGGPSREAQPSRLIAIQDDLGRIARTLEAQSAKGDSAQETERDQRDLAAQENMAKWAEFMFWATIAQIVLGLVGMIFIWRTLVYTKKAVEEAGAATHVGLAAIEQSERHARQQLRAYVAVVGIKIGEAGAPNHRSIMLQIKNTGQTPAYEVCGICNPMQVYDPNWSIPHDFDYADIPNPTRGRPAVSTAAGQMQSINTDVPSNEIEMAERGETRLFIYGRIEYLDVFGERHISEYAARYDPFAPNETRPAFVIIGDHQKQT